MNIKHRTFFAGLVLSAMALFCSTVDAGTAGKIHGFVLDKEGQPLPGVNVVIKGTRQGATTDADGFYLILSVDPGEYALTASMIGYRKFTKSGVQVLIDHTTRIDFLLEEMALEAEELVVAAERPPVELDKTSSKYIVTAKDIERLSIARSTSELVALQPGVSQDGYFRVRGGDVAIPTAGNPGYDYRPTDVAFVVDGLRVISTDGQQNSMFSGINKSAIQEVSIITGVTPAEYGNSQAGVINVVTKDGGRDYHGWGEYRNTPPAKKHWGENVYDSPRHRDRVKWGDAAWEQERDPETGRIVHQRTDYTGVTGHGFEGSISGPLSKNFSFVVSGSHVRQASPIPGPEKHGFTRDGGDFIYAPSNFQGSAAITMRAGANVKVKGGFVWQGYKAWHDGVGAGGTRGMGNNGRNLFLPEKYSSSGRYKFREDLEYLVLTHTVSPRTFYELRFSRSRSFQDTISAPERSTSLLQDEDNWFNLGVASANWERFDRRRYTLKADLSSQASKGHFVKTGAEFIFYNSWWMKRLDRRPNDVWVQYIGGDRQIGKPVKPVHAAFYAQDKMEFEGMVVNAGMRVDYFNARTRWPANSGLFGSAFGLYFTTQHLVPMDKVKSQFHFSPRLGISHPITDRMAMHFSSGMFLQYPDFYALYGQSYDSDNRDPSLDLNGDGRIGSEEFWNNMTVNNQHWGEAHLRPERSLQFEVGGDWNFVTDYTVSLTTFYRAESEQIGTPSSSWTDPVQRATVNARRNNRVEDVRGLELSVRKGFSHNFAFQVAYNLQWSENTQRIGRGGTVWSVYPDSMYIANGNWTYDWDIDPATGARIPKPLTDDEIRLYGARTNNRIRNQIALFEVNAARGSGVRAGYWDYAVQVPSEAGKEGVYIFGWSSMRGIHTWGEKPAARRNSLKIQMMFMTPRDIALGPRWMEALVRDLNVNVLYRMQNGNVFGYSPPDGGAQQWRPGPVDSRFDLEATKTINGGGRVRTSLFLSVQNLFNQKNLNQLDSSLDWVQWGLETTRPDDSDLTTYGDLDDRSRYTGTPRHVELGLRASF